MNRINMKGLSENDDFFYLNVESIEWKPEIRWTSAMLVAHVETEQGPDLRILRAELDDGSAHRVDAGAEDSGAESMVFRDGNELILSLATTSLDNGDASLMLGFELVAPACVTACNVGREPAPTVVLRNYASGELYVLNGEDESVNLSKGTWALQAVAVPDGVKRLGILRFTRPGQGEQAHRRSA